MRLYCGLWLMVVVKLGFALDLSLYQSAWSHLLAHPNQLQNFVQELPKGGDLHCHASGAVATLDLIRLAQHGQYCIDRESLVLSNMQFGQCSSSEKTAIFFKNTQNRMKALRAWSMYQFSPLAAEDGKTHFFNTFLKFSAMVPEHWPEIIARVRESAAQQQIQYLELMLAMHGVKPLALKGYHGFQNLERAEVKTFVQKNIGFFQTLKSKVQANTANVARKVDLSWILEIARNQDFEQFRLDALEVFAIAAQVPDIVGINMVQPEYAKYANRDYLRQMQWIQALKARYPDVAVVLHAGELPQSIAKKNSIDHIEAAIKYANPLRIGHGVNIRDEKNYHATLATMQKKHIAVEINLTSNDEILGIKGHAHPLHTYLKYHVPIVISSDDPGISRQNLNQEYLRAIVEQHLTLQELIAVDRNSLSYSLLPGKSLWRHVDTDQYVPECKKLTSKSCLNFIAESPKAKQQWLLEQNLSTFFSKSIKPLRKLNA